MSARRLAPAVVALLTLGCAASRPPARTEVLHRIVPATVQVVAEHDGSRVRSASGVVIYSGAEPPHSLVLTTQHLLRGLDEAKLFVLPGGRRSGHRPASPVAVNPEVDLVLLRLDGVALPGVPLGHGAALGDEVWVVGYPWGKRLSLVSGVVSQVEPGAEGEDFEGATVMVDASVSYGASGGGCSRRPRGASSGWWRATAPPA